MLLVFDGFKAGFGFHLIGFDFRNKKAFFITQELQVGSE